MECKIRKRNEKVWSLVPKHSIRAYLKLGANANMTDKESGYSLLHKQLYAYDVYNIDENICLDNTKALLEYGADSNAVNWSGETPIFRPTHKETFDILIKYRADPFKLNKMKMSGCHYSYRFRWMNFVDNFTKMGCPIWFQDYDHRRHCDKWKSNDFNVNNLIILLSTKWRIGNRSPLRRFPKEMYRLMRVE